VVFVVPPLILVFELREVLGLTGFDAEAICHEGVLRGLL
jgi:hypothetical protein